MFSDIEATAISERNRCECEASENLGNKSTKLFAVCGVSVRRFPHEHAIITLITECRRYRNPFSVQLNKWISKFRLIYVFLILLCKWRLNVNLCVEHSDHCSLLQKFKDTWNHTLFIYYLVKYLINRRLSNNILEILKLANFYTF